MQNSKGGTKTPRIGMEVVKGAMLGALVSVALIFLYAFLLFREVLGAESIRLVNALIKAVSAAAAAVFAVRRAQKRCWLIGAAAGLFYMLLAFMVFSVLSDTFVLSRMLLSDLLIGALSGTAAAALRQLKVK